LDSKPPPRKKAKRATEDEPMHDYLAEDAKRIAQNIKKEEQLQGETTTSSDT
jgi:hypothetical protein